MLASGTQDPATLSSAGVVLDGDASALGRLFAVLDAPDPDFPIVTADPD